MNSVACKWNGFSKRFGQSCSITVAYLNKSSSLITEERILQHSIIVKNWNGFYDIMNTRYFIVIYQFISDHCFCDGENSIPFDKYPSHVTCNSFLHFIFTSNWQEMLTEMISVWIDNYDYNLLLALWCYSSPSLVQHCWFRSIYVGYQIVGLSIKDKDREMEICPEKCLSD